VKPLSAAEVPDIAELRLALISLALKPAYRHLSPAALDHVYALAKRLTSINNAKCDPCFIRLIVVAECCAAKLEGVFAPEGSDLVLSELGLAFSESIAVSSDVSSLILSLSIHFYGPSKTY
jgi:hypothetical protein